MTTTKRADWLALVVIVVVTAVALLLLATAAPAYTLRATYPIAGGASRAMRVRATGTPVTVRILGAHHPDHLRLEIYDTDEVLLVLVHTPDHGELRARLVVPAGVLIVRVFNAPGDADTFTLEAHDE